ncbi:DUF305 domain-containing protein [Xylanimonas oleitrophica]|uniref:DUF305 domain-containing protein n=1 Tax=Xylanimonas oleitrophica TaxID=2607479 RepID=A0A2W5XQ90_9MICO|nr:DUF305 domain-containing protein [Xylanimonas oleitrophica]PZR51668.1 DUF305 domain-containing protein [Xylanimonas oleitrophica]
MTTTVRRAARATAFVLSLGLALAACSQSDDDAGGEEPTPSSETTASVAAEHNEADTQFAQMMIVHHQGALEMAQLATEKATTPEVQDLAGRITAAQQPEIDLMTGWLEDWGEETSASMDGMEGMDHSGMDMNGMDQEQAMADLQGLEGAEFDKQFLQTMTAHHEGAIDMAQAEIEDGVNEEATALARQIIDAQTQEIAEMGNIERSIG